MRDGHQLRAIALGDDPGAWEELGFTVSAGCVRLGNTTVVLSGSGAGFEGWWVDGLDEPLEGLANLGTPPGGLSQDGAAQDGAAQDGAHPEGPAPDRHPNGITSIDHAVVSTDDVDRTTAALAAAGIERRGGRSTSSYGEPMRQAFFWLGDVILELVGPETAGTTDPAAPDPAAPDSAVPDSARPGTAAAPRTELWGLALVAPDLDATVASLGDLAGQPKDAVQPGRRIAGLRGKEAGVSIPLAVMSPHLG